MDLAELRIFTAVVREGGVTRAAERLHRVQSNVTTRIRQLEDKLGTELFIRDGKRLHLTPSGQVLLGYADKLLALADEARTAVHDPRPRGLFRLGAMESTAAVRLPGPLNRFNRLYPEVTLELRTAIRKHWPGPSLPANSTPPLSPSRSRMRRSRRWAPSSKSR
jgi:DNA-binding transcriptional LysR family regulator